MHGLDNEYVCRKRSARRLLSLLWLFVLLAGASAWAQTNRVELEDLADRVADTLVPIEQLGVEGCPDDLDESKPSRTILQYIEGGFYKWKEYDIEVDGQKRFCIVLEKPIHARLTREEAQILLSASRLWLRPKIDPKEAWIGPPSPADLAAKPVEVLLPSGEPAPETVIGTDDRTRVADTTIYPWYTICYLRLHYPSKAGYYRGTGCLIGPYTVLTCGHNVYNTDDDEYADSVFIAPGQSQSAQDGTVVRPFGSRDAVDVETNSGYIANETFEYDYGAAFIDRWFSSITTYMPLMFDHFPSAVNIAGYPKEVQSEPNSYDQWFDADSVTAVEPSLLKYTVDTSGGNSGSPVWIFTGGNRYIVAVHAFGSTNYNGGPRLIPSNEALIEEWMHWDPYEPNDTRAQAYFLAEKTWLTDISGPGIQADDDWYRIEVSPPGYERVVVDCRFTHAEGDIDIALYDSGGTYLTGSASVTDNEYIDYTVPSAGSYYIKVHWGDAGNTYDLWWDDVLRAPCYIDQPEAATTWLYSRWAEVMWGGGAATDQVYLHLYKGSIYTGYSWGPTPNDGSHQVWVTPSWLPGTDYRIRMWVVSKLGVRVADVYSDYFRIGSPSFRIVNPNYASAWQSGSPATIQWVTMNALPSDQVWLHLYMGGVYQQRSWGPTANDGSYTLTVPTVAPGNSYQIRVAWATNGNYTDYSDAFAIGPVGLQFSNPNFTTTWLYSRWATIQWAGGQPGDSVWFHLYKGNTYTGYSWGPTANDGSHQVWVTPSWAPGTDYRIRAWLMRSGSRVADAYSTTFRIGPPTFQITYPYAATTWFRGTWAAITWNRGNALPTDKVWLHLYKGGVYTGYSWGPTENDGSQYVWVSSSWPAGTDYRIRIAWEENGNYTAYSSAFEIQ